MKISKTSKNPLEVIKEQNLLLKRFGEKGLVVYRLIGAETTIGELMDVTGLNESEIMKILEFMEENRMIDIIGEQAKKAKEEKEIKETKSINEIPQEEGEEEEEIKPTKPPKDLVGEKPKNKQEEEGEEEREGFRETLSPIEQMIYDKFGKSGVKVYNMIDGEKTAEEILKEAGISEVRLVEILEFLDSQGIIKLEKPSERKPKINEIAPITARAEEEVTTEVPTKEIIPIDVPIKTKLSFLKTMKLKMDLRFKLGKDSVKIYDKINGKKNVIDLAVEDKLSIYFIDAVLEFLADRNAAMFKTLKREEIRERYGNEGLTIYKKYGRDGIYIYELIGKIPSFRELVNISGMNPERVVDIFIYIHKVLDIDLPVSRDMLYKELGL
ncbi:hypothetical protein J7J26_01460 [Candidatus Micrarchaeota archaeon]|nr:hypothetical protein [Candidatus Micrarchaeota archaeon]